MPYGKKPPPPGKGKPGDKKLPFPPKKGAKKPPAPPKKGGKKK